MPERVNRTAIARLLLAHHPTCALFREDTYAVGRLRLCVGCFTAYPIAAAALVALALWAPGYAWWAYGAAGVAFGSIQFVSVAGAARRRRSKALVKASLGFGLALTIYAILAAPWPAAARSGALFLGLVMSAAAMLPKARRMLATCDACMHRRDWDHCPGMGLLKPRDPVLRGPPAAAAPNSMPT